MSGYSTYAVDASFLLESCLEQLDNLLVSIRAKRKCLDVANYLREMKHSLIECKSFLLEYFDNSILEEKENYGRDINAPLYASSTTDSLLERAVFLKEFNDRTRKIQRMRQLTNLEPSMHSKHRLAGTTDSQLFRLSVLLQLCLVRIDDARAGLTGIKLKPKIHTFSNTIDPELMKHDVAGRYGAINICTYSLIGTACYTAYWRGTLSRNVGSDLSTTASEIKTSIICTRTILQFGALAFSLYWCDRKWSTFWMSSKIRRSTREVQLWNQQWALSATKLPFQHHMEGRKNLNFNLNHNNKDTTWTLESINKKQSFWQSQGEMRFWMLKRGMDVFYASVGTAVDFTGENSKNNTMPLIAAAASFYYSITGASNRAAEVTSSSQSARILIQNAWGMVSHPVLKQVSLQASRMLKGAAVADRIEIAGVPCFILSADPAPELAAAIAMSNRRQYLTLNRSGSTSQLIPKLCTITEECDETDDELMSKPSGAHRRCMPFAKSVESCRQRNAILHLTGGGFFAHIIASDLPYLLDWSAATGAVIICPEYALLPQHPFPVALEQVERVYQQLTETFDSETSEDRCNFLGFEVRNIAITGESAGGNLAAALCVKIGTAIAQQMRQPAEPCAVYKSKIPLQNNQQHRTVGKQADYFQYESQNNIVTEPTSDQSPLYRNAVLSSECLPYRMPDALMLSCPVLDLSLDMKPSTGTRTLDPVLSTGLISAISDAYLPTDQLGISKKFPLASPIYATDDVLGQFPPTLIFASSTDPVLDDSVVFNQRLHNAGVQSVLYAAQNLPHAYLGLGTAGFPEARHAQEVCISWLNSELNCDTYKRQTSRNFG